MLLLNPPFFFLGNMFYTDPPAVFSLLLCMCLSLAGRPRASAAAGVFSASCRQTCALFHAFVALQSLVYLVQERRAFGCILESVAPHAAAGLLYGILFYLNSFQVAIGDHEHHAVSLHYAMFAYHAGFVILSAAPVVVVLLARIVRSSHTLTLLQYRRLVWLYATATALMLALIWKSGTYVHPFALADNRHYTFYIYRRVLLRGPYARAALSLLYGAGLSVPLLTIGLRAEEAFVGAGKKEGLDPTRWVVAETVTEIALLAVIAVCVVPASLLEPRYFVPGYFLTMVRVLARMQLNARYAWLSCFGLLIVNLAFVFVFCEMPFDRPPDPHMPSDKSAGRFMF
jgi:alpha-1,2-glucosyltransferase